MKRFLGLVMAVAGGGFVLWGGYHIMIGQSDAYLRFTDEVSVSALTAGLAGLLVFTVGLVWTRD